ncbi:hypothetical protein Tco_1288149, partial [Tanacetum coccineum]
MLVGYTDSDLAGNKDNMKSTSGYLMTFAGGADAGSSIEERAILFLEAQDRVKKGPLFK